MAVDKHVGFLEVTSDEFAGIFELGKYPGVHIVLQVNPFVDRHLGLFYFLLHLETSVYAIA